MYALLGILVLLSTFVALWISVKAKHNRILGFISLCSIGAIYLIPAIFGASVYRESPILLNVSLVLLSMHSGSIFLWLCFNTKHKMAGRKPKP